jgi:protein-tyrosine phosphatase
MSKCELFPLLTNGGLPSLAELDMLMRQGVHTLVNVSGVDMLELYGEAATQHFKIHSFVFRDVFTLRGQDDDDMIWQSFMQGEYSVFRQAVECLSDMLLRNQSVHCFCRLGVSRSSTVLAASLINGAGVSPETAMAVVLSKNPRAEFTHRSRHILNLTQQGLGHA